MTRRIISLLYLCAICVGLSVSTSAQTTPINWRMNVKMTSDTEGEVIIKAIVEPGWHLYGTELPKGPGPKPTVIDMSQSNGVIFTTELSSAPATVEKTDAMFNRVLNWWDTNVTFRRRFKLTESKDASRSVKAVITFMGCNDATCLPPTTKILTKTIK
ncbi:MAG: protein-disulfide reductase DsbD N-terminal domain-containing protein [Paramuribaculum sp.]|nr:protein-disulfide reductase DsbD N-terminal domain-containing protein [Paramuribaculum sp.]